MNLILITLFLTRIPDIFVTLHLILTIHLLLLFHYFIYLGSIGFPLLFNTFFIFITLKLTTGFSIFFSGGGLFGTGGRRPDTKHLWSVFFIGCKLPSPFFKYSTGRFNGVSA